MSVILITADFKFRNLSTCSKGPIKRAGKVCGDSQDLKSPGMPEITWYVSSEKLPQAIIAVHGPFLKLFKTA